MLHEIFQVREPIGENEIVMTAVSHQITDNLPVPAKILSQIIYQLGINDSAVRIKELFTQANLCVPGKNVNCHDLVRYGLVRHLIGYLPE